MNEIKTFLVTTNEGNYIIEHLSGSIFWYIVDKLYELTPVFLILIIFLKWLWL